MRNVRTPWGIFYDSHCTHQEEDKACPNLGRQTDRQTDDMRSQYRALH